MSDKEARVEDAEGLWDFKCLLSLFTSAFYTLRILRMNFMLCQDMTCINFSSSHVTENVTFLLSDRQFKYWHKAVEVKQRLNPLFEQMALW